MKNINLDVSHPDQVSRVLREAAETYYEDGAQLTAGWQDASAGEPWYIIAAILEDAADRIDRKIS